MSRVILVASGKGGVGKSTFSASIGVALAQTGKRVLLIDGDMGLRSLDILFDVSDKIVYDWMDVIKGRAEPEDAPVEIEGIEKGILNIVSAPLSTDIPSEEDFRDLIKYYSESFDIIIIDAPAGVGELLKIYSKCAVHGIVVATSDAASVRSAYRAGEVLEKSGVMDLRLVINKVKPDLVRAGKSPYLDEIIDKSEIRLIGVVPFSDEILQSAIGGKLSFENDKLCSKALSNIALRLLGKNVKLTKM